MKMLTRLCAGMLLGAPFPALAQIGATTPPVTREPLIDALNALAAKDAAARREAVAAIRTPAEVAARQRHVRETILHLLGDPIAQFGDALLMGLLNAGWVTVFLAVLAAVHDQFAGRAFAPSGETSG